MASRTKREVQVNIETYVGWTRKRNGYETFYLKFLCAGRWYYQHMSWSCRGGRQHYYRAMVKLYKMLRRENLSPFSLKYLSGVKIVEDYNRKYLKERMV